MPTAWLKEIITALARMAPDQTLLQQPLFLRCLFAVVLISLICGAIGSLVVGNRMAFFSDALAHCALAGVTMALLIGVLLSRPKGDPFFEWVVPLIMVAFGILVGLAIAFVREKTGLASDTVIGVFFAAAIGLGALLFTTLSRRAYSNPEAFLFGYLLNVDENDLVLLLLLTLITTAVLVPMYNQLVFTSFNVSLARTRRIPTRLCNYLFIALLALIINLSLRVVGALLINAMLVVPAATASNVCRNMRQLFWTTTGLSLAVGVLGLWLSFEVRIPVEGSPDDPLTFNSSGTIVVLSVIAFFVSMVIGPRLRGQQGN